MKLYRHFSYSEGTSGVIVCLPLAITLFRSSCFASWSGAGAWRSYNRLQRRQSQAQQLAENRRPIWWREECIVSILMLHDR